MDFLFEKGLWIVLPMIATYLVGRYLVPWLNKNQKTKETIIQPIAIFLDLFTDELVKSNPENITLEKINELLDKCIEKAELKDADEIEEAKALALKIARTPQVKIT